MADTKRKRRKKTEAVENIELSSKNINKKMILFVVLILIAITAFGYALVLALSTESGWKEIEANSTSDLNCSNEFVFLYDIGGSGNSSTAENKAITNLYSDATVDAYQIFTNDQSYEGVYNVYYVNQHPNEEIEVDETLYEAFSLIQDYKNRVIYMAPIVQYYDDIFLAKDESETVDFDPFVNEEVASYYSEIAAFANNEEAINIQLLGNNKIKLLVSEEYLKFAEENEIEDFIDFVWMKNAFIIDYLTEILVKKGYTLGSISSYDGFSRNLDERENSYSFNIYNKTEQNVYQAAVMQYQGAKSIVYLRNHIMNSLDTNHYRQMKNGEIRTSYLDVIDGKCKSAVNDLVSYSGKMGCAEVLLNVSPWYIAETFQEDGVNGLAKKGIYSVYCKENEIFYSDSEVSFSNVLKTEKVSYKTTLIEIE